MPRLGKLFKAARVQVYLPLSACKMFVPEELLFNTFLSYRGMGSFSDRSVAFQTQMGFIEVSTALTSLMFYGRVPAMCLLLPGAHQQPHGQVRSPSCVEHPWGVLNNISPKTVLLVPFGASSAPCVRRDHGPSSSFSNSHGGWESRDSTRDKSRKKTQRIVQEHIQAVPWVI